MCSYHSIYYTGVHVYPFIRSMTQLQHTYATTVVDWASAPLALWTSPTPTHTCPKAETAQHNSHTELAAGFALTMALGWGLVSLVLTPQAHA